MRYDFVDTGYHGYTGRYPQAMTTCCFSHRCCGFCMNGSSWEFRSANDVLLRHRRSNILEYVAYCHDFFLERRHPIRLKEKPSLNKTQVREGDIVRPSCQSKQKVHLFVAVASPDWMLDQVLPRRSLFRQVRGSECICYQSTELSYLQTTSAPDI